MSEEEQSEGFLRNATGYSEVFFVGACASLSSMLAVLALCSGTIDFLAYPTFIVGCFSVIFHLV